jgi:hypothetical protein
MIMCQYDNNCERQAEYGINRTLPNGEKKWVYVCDTHEQAVALNNLKNDAPESKSTA